jgi:uncharacterized ferritin-like protein (DUF455 family)
VEHCVHEARGLDVLPSTVAKFRTNGDEETAALLWDVIYAVSNAALIWLQLVELNFICMLAGSSVLTSEA